MRYKFNIGDRVRVLDGSKIKDYTRGWYMIDAIGKEGIITRRSIIKNLPAYKIKFINVESDMYRFCVFDERELEFVGFDAINFVIIGRKVYARMCDSNGEVTTSEAKCHPDDDFDLKTGMNIALDRLLAKASLYNGKLVCIENNDPVKIAFTKGKIYTIVNGEIKDDYGMTPFRKIKSLDEFDKVKGIFFIPLVE